VDQWLAQPNVRLLAGDRMVPPQGRMVDGQVRGPLITDAQTGRSDCGIRRGTSYDDRDFARFPGCADEPLADTTVR